MKILFLAPRLPLPADTGGKIRTLNILKQLAKRAQVRLVCFSFEAKDREIKEDFRKWNVDVSLVGLSETSGLQKVVNVMINPMPHSMAKYASTDMYRYLLSLREKERFDAVHVDHLHMAHYRPCFADIPAVLDEHNVEFMILSRCVPVEKNILKKLAFQDQAGKMKKYESEHVKQFARFLAVSDDDKKILHDLCGGKVRGETVPNGVDTDFFKSTVGGRPSAEEDALVFTGSMDWLPNEDAVVYFSKEVLPFIWKKKPDVKFYVVGKGAKETVIALGRNDSRIIVTGRVDDVRPVMERSKVFVVPIRVGGGTRLKILEAMSMEKAVVSTTIGAEGIRHTDGKNILLADDPEGFAQKVCSLLDDPSKAGNMGRAGRDLVCSFYDWNIIGERLNTIYQEVAHGR